MAETNALNQMYLFTSFAPHMQMHKSWFQGCAMCLPSTPYLAL